MLDFSRARLKPFKHQEEDTESLIKNPYFFITSEMRTGKTKIVIDAAQFLFEAGTIDRMLVIAPAPVRDVWYDPDIGELHKHLWLETPTDILEFHARSRSWHHGPISKTRTFSVAITNYEFIRNSVRLMEILPFCTSKTLLVLDESSFIKTYSAEQSKACYTLRWHCGRVVLLNGTPISHSPIDLFSQGNILHPAILNCRFITHFRARYAVMGGYEVHGRPTQITGWVNLDDLQRRFAPYVVRRLQKDCLDLPPKLDPVTLTCELKSATWKIYKQMRDDCIVMLEGARDASIASQAITKALRLSQITSGFVGGMETVIEDSELEMGEKPDWIVENELGFCESRETNQNTGTNSSGTREIGREKLDTILWFLKQRLEAEPNLHIVVWCRFRPELFRMFEAVKKEFPQFQVGAIHGGQKKVERLASMQLLHPDSSPKGPVFVGGTFGTGAFGLNFTAANTSVNCSFDYSLGKFLQSADRVYGPGQISPVAYFDIIATGPQGQKTIDHVIVKARRNKENIANWTTEAWVKALKGE